MDTIQFLLLKYQPYPYINKFQCEKSEYKYDKLSYYRFMQYMIKSSLN
ncbi:hypothetical protein EV697_102252 [Bisgaardia hudsonensis]|uniref:Uncharacterized protein n=1 Tax=Bisgaardia hudsonensis TaxID=109472 RepID=A0A4R2N1F5_9PAST|nr:hypothetical protein EV697_102252 [Bisgaardia hudsonensis]